MIRESIWLRAMRVIVFALMVLMIAPLAGADDYSFLFPQANLSVEFAKAPVAMEDDDASHDCCPCMLCMDALAEYAPLSNPKETGIRLALASPNSHSSLYRPEILRPPIY